MKILTLNEVRGRFGGCAIGTVEKNVNDATMPPPLKYGQKRVWPEVEIEAVVAAISAGYGELQLRELTAQLVEARPVRAAKAIAEAVEVLQ
jgi:hypothetical protein